MTSELQKRYGDLADLLRQAGSILLFPHVHMDGDSFGSAVALTRALRALGKTAWILIAEDIPDNLAFLDDGLTTRDPATIERPDASVAIDCSDLSRLESREAIFAGARVTAVVDHHMTFRDFAGINLIDPEAAATGELVYEILKRLDVPVDKPIAEALYAAIATDTGNFQYSNTTANTHRIMAELYQSGMDHARVAVALYQSVRPARIRLLGAALNEVSFRADGRAAIATVTQDMLHRTGAKMSESEGIVETLRSIRGVEVAAVLKEEAGGVRVGLRSKAVVDVAAIAAAFGGGGHVRASGYTSRLSPEEATEQLAQAIEACFGG